MSDLTDAYTALQKADAAGDTDGATQLAAYIKSQSAPTASKPTPVSPTDDSSIWQNAAAGAGKFLHDAYIGNAQIGSAMLSPFMPSEKENSKAMAQEVAETQKRDAPLMATGGGKIGYYSTGLLGSLVPGADTAVGATALGAAQGALMPTAPGQSRADNTMLGAGGGTVGNAVGGLLSNVLGKAGSAVNSSLTAAQQQAMKAGQYLGMKLTPGQQSGSMPLMQLEAKLESQPWTSGPFNAIRDNNNDVLARATAQSIGENTTRLDSTVLGRAANRLGNVFESVRSPNNIIAVDPKNTTGALSQIANDSDGLLKNGASILDHPLVKRLTSLVGTGGQDGGYLSQLTMGANQPTVVNGQQIGALTSRLGKSAYNEMSTPSGDRELGKALYAVKNHVDDLVQGSLNGDQQAEYAAARGQYRNLIMLTSRSGIVNPSSGQVSGAMLANKLQQADKPGFLYGGNQSDMYNAARFAQAFKPAIGNSGTATRSPNYSDVMELPLGLSAMAISKLYNSKAGAAAMRGLMQGGSSAAEQLAPLFSRQILGPTGGLLLPHLSQE